MSMPVKNVIPLEGGSIVCGMVITLAIQNFMQHGVSVKVIKDRDRQKFLILVCSFVVVAGVISLGLNQTGELYILQNFVLMIIFWGVQLGLGCVNHNTIIRTFIALASVSQQKWRPQTLSYYCLALYPLTAIVLIPIYMGFPSSIEKHQGVNASAINKEVFKPLNVALVIATEVLATISDLLLILRVEKAESAAGRFSTARAAVRTNGTVSSNVVRKSAGAEFWRRLWMHYGLIWTTVVLDVLLKILIYLGYPVLFDSQVTNATILLRAVTNLQFGTTLKQVYTVSGETATRMPATGSGLASDFPKSVTMGARGRSLCIIRSASSLSSRASRENLEEGDAEVAKKVFPEDGGQVERASDSV
ncbi:uncharacterized protein EV422DRAFT_513619 [Fimicolochytrium jonesii]|uniref:uncharacterized protein n=1 Tax=Fimicolochytrium jonesii TaxID=1396493 RepID=UPI0022FE2A9A|nr:uncharacterized protein EV422DRAFT_513619 [Fimicolochytrium jonesii]KAI8825629.1 hypothetical protein EV422DRAFT_513619 [Fimicolochytrium jonesii]